MEGSAKNGTPPSMKEAIMRAALIFLSLFSGTGVGAECFCDQSLPIFAADPLQTPGTGLTSYVNPGMVDIDPWTGECRIGNEGGFFEEDAADGVFDFRGRSYRLVQLYSDDNFTSYELADAEMLNEWATLVCAQKLSSS